MDEWFVDRILNGQIAAGNHLRDHDVLQTLAHNTLATKTVFISFYMYLRFCDQALVGRYCERYELINDTLCM